MRNINAILKLIKSFLITEKSILLNHQNKCVLLIDKKISKNEINFFFEIFYNIKLKSINICNLPKKSKKIKKYTGYISQYKKFYINFNEKSHLDNFLRLKNYFYY